MYFADVESMKKESDRYGLWTGCVYSHTHKPTTKQLTWRWKCSKYGKAREKKLEVGKKQRNRTTHKCGCMHQLTVKLIPAELGGDGKQVYLSKVTEHSNGCVSSDATREVGLRRKGMNLSPALMNRLAGIVESQAGGKVVLSLRTFLNLHPAIGIRTDPQSLRNIATRIKLRISKGLLDPNPRPPA